MGETLKICLVSTAVFPVPPRTYGGLEQVVYDLAVALRDLGHEVTVVGVKGSKLPEGISVIETVEPQRHVGEDWFERERRAFMVYRDRLKEFDIVHDHTWLAFPYLEKKRNPDLKLCHTHHGHCTWPTPPPVKYPNLVGISKFLANEISKTLGVTVLYCYNGIDVQKYSFCPEKEEFLVYVGRMAKYKQPHVAVEVARQSKTPVYLIGGETFVEDPSYVQRVRSMCDGWYARWIGECPHDVKIKLLQKAKALLFPSQFGEPFGLVAVEAMACGTPVIALRDGAIPEVVKHGATGFVCDSVEEMVEAVGRVDGIKPEKCRRRVERLFSREVMARNYLKLYRRVLSGEEW